jgi:hypothetical protein
MEVLEKPKAKKKWSTQVICMGVQDVRIGCGAILKISEDDLFRVKVGNVGRSRWVAQFQCPECGVHSDFFGYPEPVVLLDYCEHADYKASSDLQGYHVERWDSRIWNTHEAYLRSIGYQMNESGNLVQLDNS